MTENRIKHLLRPTRHPEAAKAPPSWELPAAPPARVASAGTEGAGFFVVVVALLVLLASIFVWGSQCGGQR